MAAPPPPPPYGPRMGAGPGLGLEVAPASVPRICTQGCRYAVLGVAAKALRMAECAEAPEDGWDLFWSDLSVSPQRLLRMRPYQRINHFPGMMAICRKASLAKVNRRMAAALPHLYDFTPETFTCTNASSNELEQLLALIRRRHQHAQAHNLPSPVFIVKPDAGAMGRGIMLATSERDLVPRSCRGCVVQEYIHRPLLVSQRKFDLRIYVLVTRADPIRIFLFAEGLARFATDPYTPPTRQNLNRLTMHLTNYSVNKHAADFQRGENGSKRTLSSLMETLHAQGRDTGALWRSIQSLVVKTVLPIQPHLAHAYHSAANRPRSASASLPQDCGDDDSVSRCFELLGLDVLIDDDLKPWLVEVNHSPSFNCDADIDVAVKMATLTAAIKSLHLDGAVRCAHSRAQRRAQDLRLYRTPMAQGRAVPREQRHRGAAAAAADGDGDGDDGGDDDERGKNEAEPRESLEMVHGGFARIFPPLPDRLETLAWAQAAASAANDGAAGVAAWKEHEEGGDVAEAYEAELASAARLCKPSLPTWMACRSPQECNRLVAQYREVLQNSMLMFEAPGCSCRFCRARAFWMSMGDTSALLGNKQAEDKADKADKADNNPGPADKGKRKEARGATTSNYFAAMERATELRALSRLADNLLGDVRKRRVPGSRRVGSAGSPRRVPKTGPDGEAAAAAPRATSQRLQRTRRLGEPPAHPPPRPSPSARALPSLIGRPGGDSHDSRRTMQTISRVVGGFSLGAYSRALRSR